MKQTKTSIVLALALMSSTFFIGCGGKSSDNTNSKVGTTGAFAFTSPGNKNILMGESMAIDVDAIHPDGTAISYALSGVDADNFSIDDKGVVTFNSRSTIGDFNFTVTATAGSETITQDITITVALPPNNAPVISSPNTANAKENQTDAITITATDEDGDDLTYSLTGGADKNSMSINQTTGKVSFKVAPNFEDKSSYIFTVGASDGILTDTQNVTIKITDVDEGSAPVFINSSSVRVNENQKEAITIKATDIDRDPIVYSFTGGADDDSFTINASSGKIRFKSYPDYETKNSYNITVGASDGTATTNQDISIQILDMDGKSKLVQTGQISSFTPDDDGDTRIGVERSFKHVDTSYSTYLLGIKTGTVNEHSTQDIKTGLIWQDNKPPIGNYTTAVKYCQNLKFNNKTDWRLPKIMDFQFIANRGASNPAKFSNFRNIKTNKLYWTSTQYSRGDNQHYAFDFNAGNDHYINNAEKLNISCVRGATGIYNVARLLKSGDRVYDLQLKLQWADNKPLTFSTWQGAINSCKTMSLGGESDWRLPNINELLSLIDHRKTHGTAFFDAFKYNKASIYHSSTTNDKDDIRAWAVDFRDGTDHRGVKKVDQNYYRCVRTYGD